MYGFTAEGKHISVFPAARPGAPMIYLNTCTDEGRQVFGAVSSTAGCPPFTLAAISDLDWNRDMSPWNSPAAFKGGEAFAGGADDCLRLLVEEIMPRAEKELAGPPAWRGIAGYSLAGLFALYAVYRTDVFSRVGCMSGSLWFPGFKEICFLPRAETLAGPHLFLSGGQGVQDPQSDPANRSGRYGEAPGFLPGQRHRHGVPAESRQPLCPWGRADRSGHTVAAEQVGAGYGGLIFSYCEKPIGPPRRTRSERRPKAPAAQKDPPSRDGGLFALGQNRLWEYRTATITTCFLSSSMRKTMV